MKKCLVNYNHISSSQTCIKHKDCYPHFIDKFSLCPSAPTNLFIALEVCAINYSYFFSYEYLFVIVLSTYHCKNIVFFLIIDLINYSWSGAQYWAQSKC